MSHRFATPYQLLGVLIVVAGFSSTAIAASCPISAEIPHDVSASNQSQKWFDMFSWESFSAVTQAQPNGQGVPLWNQWSSTADYLNLTKAGGGNPPAFGERYYPSECQAIEGYDQLRVIEQVGKVADTIFEANATGLSNSPVVDANGYFVRYEIMMNEDQYDYVTQQQLYRASNISSGTDQAHVNATCGVAGGAEGVINVKLAWMVINPTGGDTSGDLWPRANYITEELLIYNGANTTSDGQATCTKRLMGLVGMHIAHKTQSQPSWAWSTFEHVNNAPDCGAWPDGGANGGVNTNCPAANSSGAFKDHSMSWNFLGTVCASHPSKCQTCNAVPAGNGGANTWYANKQPSTVDAGRSQICRMVSTETYDSASLNQACQDALGSSVVKNYELISTQWFDWTEPPQGCSDVAGTFDSVLRGGSAGTARDSIRPQVAGTNTSDKPILANTSMESYERSNCTGCHAKGALTNPNCASAGAADCKAEAWDGTAMNGMVGYLPIQGSGSATGSGCGTGSGVPCAPTDAYNFTDFSWWYAVEVPVDGVQ